VILALFAFQKKIKILALFVWPGYCHIYIIKKIKGDANWFPGALVKYAKKGTYYHKRKLCWLIYGLITQFSMQ